MESGIYSLPRKLSVVNTDQVFFNRSVVATTVSGTVNIGDGPFDGISAGKFFGVGTGTILAINAVSGFTGAPIDIQVGGNSKFRMNSTGTIVLGASLEVRNSVSSTPNFSVYNMGSAPIDGTSSGFFTGNSTGTFIGINAPNNSSADFLMCQVFGVQKFRIDSAGNAIATGALNDGVGLGAGGRLDNYYSFT